jgi:hypothetical protein
MPADTAKHNAGLQLATPGRRYVELAQAAKEAGMSGIVRSICDASFSSALGAITGRIAEVLRGACLPRALNPDATGRVNCNVVEILPEGVTCAEQAPLGRDATPLRIDTINGVDRQVCTVNQLVPTQADRDNHRGPDGTGWYYDDYTADTLDKCPGDSDDDKQRISFSDGAGPYPGSDIRPECLQPVQGGGLTGPDIFKACDPAAPVETSVCSWTGAEATEQAGEFIVRYNLDRDAFIDAQSGALTAQAHFCEAGSRTCQITCDSAAQCPGGFVCYDPETDGSQCQDPSHPCFCLNPTCSSESSSGGATSPDAGM